MFETREGYCTYYASAMVLMLRSQGILARPATGFAQGEWDETHGRYVVRERDAHMWVEVYFPDHGWVEFDPTGGERIPPEKTPTPLPAATSPPTSMPNPIPSATVSFNTPPPPDSTQTLDRTPQHTPAPLSPTPTMPPDDETDQPPGDGNGSGLIIGSLMISVTLALLVPLFAIWRVENRGLENLNSIERVYGKTANYARWLGLWLDESATPDEHCRYIANAIPSLERPITLITRMYVKHRYARPYSEGINQSGYRAQHMWHAARWAFIRHKFSRFLSGSDPGE